MKINFRKIASALASTAMVGSTVALAAAANFPAPFVANGAADVAIVYGSQLDLAAVTDVSSALSSALAGSAGGVPVTDEAYALFTSSTPLQLNNSINSVKTSVTDTNLPSVLGDEEFSGNVDATITYQITPGSNPRPIFAKEPTSNDDPGVGVLLSTTSGNYLYNASASFSKAVAFNNTDSEGEELMLFGKPYTVASATDDNTLVLFQSAQTIFLTVGGASPVPSTSVTVGDNTYTIELVAATDTSATIKVTDSSGASDQKEINEDASKKVQGVEIAVTTSDESTATNTLSAEVIVGANKLTFEDAATVTVGSDNDPIDGTKIDFTDGSPGNMTKLTIQVFASDGDEDFIKSGEAFIDPVFSNFRVALQGLSVEADSEDREDISVDNSGADKMTTSFTNWQDKEKSNLVWLNNASNGWGKSFLGDSSNKWQIAVAEMARINESSYAVVGNEDEGYLVRLKTLSNSTTTSASDDDVVFENVFDTSQTWEASISTEGTGTIDIGGKSYSVTYRDNTIDNVEDQYAQLNYPDSSAGGSVVLYPTIETSKGAKLFFYEPLMVNLQNWNGLNGTNNVTQLRFPDGDGYTDIAVEVQGGSTGDNLNHTWTVNGISLNLTTTGGATAAPAALPSTYPVIGKLTYNITRGVYAGAQVLNAVTLGGDAVTDLGENHSIALTLMDPSSNVSITRPAIVLFEEQDESNNYEAVVIQTSGAGTTSSGTGVSDIDFTWNKDAAMDGTAYGATGYQMETDDDLYQMMDQFGTLVTTDQSDSDQYTATVSYPDDQVTALLYVDALGTAGGSTTLGDVKVLDDELATSGMQTKNLVVVGGSCVNTVASTLLGGSAGCGASWTAATGAGTGEWIIQTWANPWASSKVATLVAGWEQGDTKNAATYITTQTTTTGVGSKLTGTTATAATVVTSGTTA